MNKDIMELKHEMMHDHIKKHPGNTSIFVGVGRKDGEVSGIDIALFKEKTTDDGSSGRFWIDGAGTLTVEEALEAAKFIISELMPDGGSINECI